MTKDSETAATTKPSSSRDPVVIDLGRHRKKKIKQLRQGTGPLLDEVNGVINELRTAGAVTGTVQPVIVIVRERADSSKFPFMGMLGK